MKNFRKKFLCFLFGHRSSIRVNPITHDLEEFCPRCGIINLQDNTTKNS